jgi:hypothetical protein
MARDGVPTEMADSLNKTGSQTEESQAETSELAAV